jgi:antibiotic biosynthesis monooxygenase (ABM) superfamily enzyme
MFAASFYLYTSTPTSPAWERVLLSVMVLATVVTGLLLIVFGFRQKMPLAGWLFIINLVGIFLLNGLARMDEQTITLQWIEESINTISWLSFAVAAKKVFAYTRNNFGVK